jgi:hypothetical protein
MAALRRESKRALRLLRWSTLALLCAGLAVAEPSMSRAQTVSEYGLKAVFLFNFTQFVEWPSHAFSGPDDPLCIGILGDDPFGMTLDQAIRGEKSQGHPLTVRRSRDPAALSSCHVVFVAESERARIDQVLAGLGGGSTLTVGETEGFAQRGGVIGFYRDGSKLRFEISTQTARRKDLKISSQLLNLGRIVEPSES